MTNWDDIKRAKKAPTTRSADWHAGYDAALGYIADMRAADEIRVRHAQQLSRICVAALAGALVTALLGLSVFAFWPCG